MMTLKKVVKVLLKLFFGLSLLVLLGILGFFMWVSSPFPYIKTCRSLGSSYWSEPPCRNNNDYYAVIRPQLSNKYPKTNHPHR